MNSIRSYDMSQQRNIINEMKSLALTGFFHLNVIGDQ